MTNAMSQRKKRGKSDSVTHPRSFRSERATFLMEPMTSRVSSLWSLGQLLARVRLASDQTPSSGFSSGA